MFQKRAFLSIVLLIISQFSFSQNDWENELMFEQNKLRARVPSYSFTSHNDALEGNRETSRMQSLNGLWKFNFVLHNNSYINLYKFDLYASISMVLVFCSRLGFWLDHARIKGFWIQFKLGRA